MRKRKSKISKSTVLLVLILLAGLTLLLYPSVSNWWNSFHQTQAIASYVEKVDDMSAKEKESLLESARSYNERLAKTGVHLQLSEKETSEYNSLLDITGTGIMGYIKIPKINVNLPIYHGTEDSVLQVAIGHLAGTSFPIGGESTHAAVSGHRGLPSAKLFTDLDKIEEGDLFSITVLDESITYKVDQIRIVLPEEVADLRIDDGKDYCTLITCTPYGINSHRMLIRGARAEDMDQVMEIAPDAVRVPIYIVAMAIGIPIIFFLLIGMLIVYRRRT